MLEFMAKVPAMVGDMAAKVGAQIAAGAAGSSEMKFSVDPDQAEQLAKDLEAAVKELEALYRKVEPLTEIPSPGKDMYSGMAVSKIREIAGDNPGGYLLANREARTAIQATADKVREALEHYKATEGNNQNTFR